MTILGGALQDYNSLNENKKLVKLLPAANEMVRLLVNAKGINLNEWNILSQPELSWKFTALMDAVAFPDIVKLLLDKGALIDLQDDWLEWDGKLHESGGNTALMLAIGNEQETHTESAKILIERGAKIDLQNRMYETALMLAVHNTEIAKILIDKGAKIDIQDVGGETALMKAAGKYTDVVKLLLDKGANILTRQQAKYDFSQNALDYAAKAGNIPAAKLILAKAVSLGVKDEIIRVALHWAVLGNQVEMAKYLLDEGAYIEGNDKTAGYTPLMETSNFEMVQLLVKRGAKVNAKNFMNYTPLHKAVFNFMDPKNNEKECEKIINFLLDNGAVVDVQDKNGITPLMGAVQKITPVKILLGKGANVNLQNTNGETALMYAVKGGLLKVVLTSPLIGSFTDAVKMLLDKGADVNLQDKSGKTALMHAAGAVSASGDKYSSYTDMIQLLLDRGAKLETTDKEGHTALFWAQRYGRTLSSELLLSKGANPNQKYDRKTDKSNIKAGIVGTWTSTMKVDVAVKRESFTIVNKVIFNADWSYSKTTTVSGQTTPDGGGYNAYDLRDGRIWLTNKMGIPAVLEYRFEGATLILNGEKYTKVQKK
jgi:ankyrin repeat protein